jgi:hypothetical protein
MGPSFYPLDLHLFLAKSLGTCTTLHKKARDAMNTKPLIYLDTDLAISCFMRSLYAAGLSDKAELLLGLTVSNPDSARHAQRLVAGLPKTAMTEKAQRGALEMLEFAAAYQPKTPSVQAPIDLS